MPAVYPPPARTADPAILIDAAFNFAGLPFHAIAGDYPQPWTGAEATSPDGTRVRAYSDDTDVVVVAFDRHGVEASRARFTRMPADVIEAALVAAFDIAL